VGARVSLTAASLDVRRLFELAAAGRTTRREVLAR